jgi:CRISPR-associated protein Csm3
MITIDSKLVLVTGLHIGGADDSMKIGGVDSPVMKREVFCDDSGVVGFKHTKKITEPYIAGSSLKGKIRTLLEHYFRLVNPLGDGKPVGSNSSFGDTKYIDLIVHLFGDSSDGRNAKRDKKIKEIEITRAIFRDCFITQEVRKAYINNKIKLTEEKYENVIDRKTGTTIAGGLRQIERVPSAVEFDFNMSIRVFDEVNRELFKNTILLGLKLLELDALGGNGSRGYGRIRFNDFKIDNKTVQLEMDIEKLRKKIDNELDKSKN